MTTEGLSLGDIAKLTNYSRARIHRLAVDGRIPSEPLRRPPKGQYRFRDTPELRDWCKAKRKAKPKALPRRFRQDTRSASARVRRAIGEMESAIQSGKADPSDIENALELLGICSPLAHADLFGNPQPCTKGVLAILAQFLLGWALFDARRFARKHAALNALQKELRKRLAATRKAQRSSQKQPA